MKIAVIGANGKAGKLIAQEAMSRGYDVTGIARNELTYKSAKLLKKDLFSLRYDDLKEFDIIVCAFAVWTPETLEQHITGAKHLCEILANKPNRLIIVGGAGSLYVNPEHSVMLMDTPDFPSEFMGVAKATGKSLEVYRNASDVLWTYISPAADFRPDGAKTGVYKLGGEELMVDSEGVPQISYADFAIATIDVAEKDAYTKERISVVAQ